MQLFTDIHKFYGIEKGIKRGNALKHFSYIENAYLAVENGIVKDFGQMDALASSPYASFPTTSLKNQNVFPCFADSHTHLVFARGREGEFVDKIQGKTYEEIAASGGGILNSARKLGETSEDDLFASALERIELIMRMGTGAVEIKSGYGLTVESELKMLRVIQRLKQAVSIPIKSTFLGAHAIPTEYKENREGYMHLLIHEMLPAIGAEKLADYCDVFCDKGFFTPEETERILEAGYKHGLKPKLHANELDYSGGIQTGVKMKAVSVDHLEFTGDAELNSLLSGETIPTLLPSTAFFLRLHYPPARNMISAGLPVALASDFNPGSSPSGNMMFVLSLACIQLRMLPEEAMNAATLNGAAAMELEHLTGSLAIGKKANFFTTDSHMGLHSIPYYFGHQLIKEVYIDAQKLGK